MKVNKHTSHPSVFISSTFIDLQEERESVADALHSRGLIINALDTKPTSNNTSTREIIDGIKESDFVVLIIGDRYGSVLKTMTGSYSKSITSWEYEIGIACGKPVIAYFKDGESSDPKNHDEVV